MKKDNEQTAAEKAARRAKGKAHMEAKWQEKADILASNKEQRASRSPLEQLRVLDRRLGVGKGAKKERARLLAMVSVHTRAAG